MNVIAMPGTRVGPVVFLQRSQYKLFQAAANDFVIHWEFKAELSRGFLACE